MSLAADLSSEIEGLAATDETTIELDTVGNVIRLKETVAAPASGTRTFEGAIIIPSELHIGDILIWNGENGWISTEESARISGDASVAADLSSEVSRAESAEFSLQQTYFGKVETTVADGTTAVFNHIAVKDGSLTVYLNGLLQDSGADYNDDGSAITFVEAPLNGDKIVMYGEFYHPL
jgi:hypothetical protein